MNLVMQKISAATVRLSGQDLSTYIGVSQSALSRAVRRDYKAGGYRVSEWADWHHNHRRIEGYDVPRSIARKVIPKDQWESHGIGQTTETVRVRNPRPLPLNLPPKDAAQYAAQLLRSLSDVEELRGLDLETVADRLKLFGS